jgi:hypothetical protein
LPLIKSIEQIATAFELKRSILVYLGTVASIRDRARHLAYMSYTFLTVAMAIKEEEGM